MSAPINKGILPQPNGRYIKDGKAWPVSVNSFHPDRNGSGRATFDSVGESEPTDEADGLDYDGKRYGVREIERRPGGVKGIPDGFDITAELTPEREVVVKIEEAAE